MSFSRFQKILAPLLLSVLLLVSACSQPTETRWDQAQQDSTQRGAKVQPATGQPQVPGGSTVSQVPAGKAVAGSKFNKFFPAAGGGFQRVFTQEKTGFAEAKLNQGSKTVAMLSVNDLANNPNALQKFQKSGAQIAGFPAAETGSTMTSVLVGNRYQVKVQSRDPSFTSADRQAWITKFNLKGIAGIK